MEETDGKVENKSREQQQQRLSDDIIARFKLLEVGLGNEATASRREKTAAAVELMQQLAA
ncbi:hypothetical protein WN943_023548 [Citrus x changshan-huyou]